MSNPGVKHQTCGLWAVLLVSCAILLVPASAQGQVFSWTREQMIAYTAQNPYERFPDGRPKVPDSILQRVRELSAEEVIGIAGRGYPNQFVDGMQVLHPGKKLVGRAFTVQLMPMRADVTAAQAAELKAKGSVPLSHQTAIDMLQPGDVLVMDVFGSIPSGGIIGDNLTYYIWKTTGAGFVIDGAIRDLEGVTPIDVAGYFRGATPTAIRNVTVTGINIPIRIGNTTVLPGDVVLGDREGVYFIPPHLVKDLVDAADITRIHDEWTKMKFDEGKYKSSEIYSRPRDPALIKEYEEYLKLKLGAARYEEYVKRQSVPR
jgi:4-hydroxy-4-methyl-2-oxoglutarate aldolase